MTIIIRSVQRGLGLFPDSLRPPCEKDAPACEAVNRKGDEHGGVDQEDDMKKNSIDAGEESEELSLRRRLTTNGKKLPDERNIAKTHLSKTFRVKARLSILGSE